MRCIAGISGKCVPSGVNITSSPVFFYHQRGNQGEQNRRQQYGFMPSIPESTPPVPAPTAKIRIIPKKRKALFKDCLSLLRR
ncbi:MAG: hypothetical protein IJK60_04395 [Clostridia bacterium]|nr:hypothetical protein [Clostridia bacterium]